MHIGTGGARVRDRLFRQTCHLKRIGFKRGIPALMQQCNIWLNGDGLVCRYKTDGIVRCMNGWFVPDFSEKHDSLNFKDGISNKLQAPAALPHSKSPPS